MRKTENGDRLIFRRKDAAVMEAKPYAKDGASGVAAYAALDGAARAQPAGRACEGRGLRAVSGRLG